MSAKPKLLFLHGYGEGRMIADISGKTMKDSLDAAGIAVLPHPEGFDLLKTDEEMAPIVDPDYRKMCLSGDMEARAWYPFVKMDGPPTKPLFESNTGHRAADACADFNFRSDPEKQKAAVSKLVALIESVGGIDGVAGFSQGGELCYLLAESLSQLNSHCRAQLKFIATFGSEDVFLQRGTPPVAIDPGLRFFICYGKQDAEAVFDSQTTAKSLRAAGAGSVTVHEVADLGHGMPKCAVAFEKMVAEFAEARALPKAAEPPMVFTDENGDPLPPIAKPLTSFDIAARGPPPGWGEGTYEERQQWLKDNPYRPKAFADTEDTAAA